MAALLSQKVTRTAVFPGSGDWLAGANTETILTGKREGGEPRKLTYGGKKSFEYGIIAMHGIDASTIVMTDGVWVTKLERSPKALKPVKRWKLPGEMGWRAKVDVSADGELIAVASDARLAVYGAHEKVITGGAGFPESFMCVRLLPGGTRLVTGRGDGRLELRDVQTLEVLKTFTVVKAAILCMAALDERTVALGDDFAKTGLLDLESGTFTELPLASMKTSGLHRLADGRLVVVGLSRRVTVFSGTQKVGEADLSAELGDRYIQDSALDGDTVLLACEERGLHALDLSALPASAPPIELPRPAGQIRSDTTLFVQLNLFMEAAAAKQDVTALIKPLLEHADEELLRAVFSSLQHNGLVLPEAEKYLRSPIERVRFYAADQFGALPDKYAGRALELEPLIADESPKVVAAAMWAMGRLGDARCVPSLIGGLQHREEWVRSTAVLALLALRAGRPELVEAIRAGAGELTLAMTGQYWPKLTPALLALLDPALLTKEAPLRELLAAIQVDASPAFLEAVGAKTYALPPGVKRVWEVVWKLGGLHRWAVTFSGERLKLLTASEAAEWWNTELSGRFGETTEKTEKPQAT